MDNQDDRIREAKHWEPLFPPEMVQEAKTDEVQSGVHISSSRYIIYAQYGESWLLPTGRKRSVSYDITIRGIPAGLKDQWESRFMHCTCPEGKKGKLCVHEAAVLALYEKKRGGPVIATESEDDYRKRKAAEAAEVEKRRLDALKKKLGTASVPALDFFINRPEMTGNVMIYDMAAALKGWKTNAYEMARAEEIQAGRHISMGCSETVRRDGTRFLTGEYSTRLVAGTSWSYDWKAVLEGSTLTFPHRDPDSGYEDAKVLTGAELLIVERMWDAADAASVKVGIDMTDEKAKLFFAAMEPAAVVQLPGEEKKTEKAERTPCISIYPKISMENRQPKLSFRMGREGGKALAVRKLKDLVALANDGGKLGLSKKETIDFSVETFTAESEPLFDFISRRVSEVEQANRKLERRNGYGSYYYGGRTLSVGSAFDLAGALLDGFYETAEGMTCEYVDKAEDVETEITVSYHPLKTTLYTERITDAKGDFAGIRVYGYLPPFLKGATHSYILNTSFLSRAKDEELERLAPFRKVADGTGYFNFQIGTGYLQEFYYRVIPRLLSTPGIEVVDKAEEEAQKYLPPEAAFTFYLDYAPGRSLEDAGLVTLRGTVSYADRQYTLGERYRKGDYHDAGQEKRIEEVILNFLDRDEVRNGYSRVLAEEDLGSFVKDAVPVLEQYGSVKGTDAFRSLRIRPVPQMKVGISVESGILNLSLTSKGFSQEELQRIFESYQQKKKWYRLSSGDFVDIREDDQMGKILDLFQGMDLDTEEVIRNCAKIPMYRALYLDRLLQEHEDIASSRDRIYRALIRNFQTVRDSETEPPASLENTLRPYQVYGYKWLMTLTAAGFGGILADEMGLGKTIQMISVLVEAREEDPERKNGPSLIVCPASLVYNWKEEFTRFAPGLQVQVLAGPAASRKTGLEDREKTDAYIISYDLLKRNIAKFEQQAFDFVVLDEAQFIKNTGAAVTKAVKVLHARHRFALTGTPIENRLSELWSIFDFLMPGFLYSRKDFEKKLEIPVTKGKDAAATKKLRDMTSPFILRRRKEDVLKDLPEKLEEVRYVPLAGEQQKLYDAQVLRIRDEIMKDEKIRVFAELTRIREICCDPSLIFEDYQGESAKRSACMDLIRTAIESGHRMLVFSQFTSMLALLEKDLEEAEIPYYILTGSTSKEKRITLVHDFNEGDVPVFLISLKAGGTGLNLTGADMVIHYDPWWNLAAQNQATDRTHRIGQTKQVTVYRMIMKDTIEERILELQETKRDLAESILGGESTSLMSLSKEELLQLLGD